MSRGSVNLENPPGPEPPDRPDRPPEDPRLSAARQRIADAREADRRLRRAAAQRAVILGEMIDDAVAHPDIWIDRDAIEADRDFGAKARLQEIAVRSATAELALALTMSATQVADLAATGSTLRRHCPRVLAAFEAGDVSAENARTVADLAVGLSDSEDDEAWELFDGTVLDAARSQPPGRFRVTARRIRERITSEPLEARRTDAERRSFVHFEPALDGMAYLTAYGPADSLLETMRIIDARALPLAEDPAEKRSLGQLRVQVLRDLLGINATVEVQVSVVVPVLSLLDRSEAPATLDGMVPIDAETARRLTGGSKSWERILTHPISGTVLDVGRDRYRPPADLTRYLRAVHSHCVFPGCRVAAENCDLDHVTPWSRGGTTSAANLRPVCRAHHRLKHLSGHELVAGPGGATTWRTPLDERYGAEPPF